MIIIILSKIKQHADQWTQRFEISDYATEKLHYDHYYLK